MANPALAPVREPAVAYANANPVRLERAIIERARFYFDRFSNTRVEVR
jgi:hypothetical protein